MFVVEPLQQKQVDGEGVAVAALVDVEIEAAKEKDVKTPSIRKKSDVPEQVAPPVLEQLPLAEPPALEEHGPRPTSEEQAAPSPTT